MPKRNTTTRVDSSKVQGENAWLDWKNLTWGQRRDIRLEMNKLNDGEKMLDHSRKFILEHLLDWNWVNGNEEKLQLPKAVEDFDNMLDAEVEFLFEVAAGAIRGDLGASLTEKKD